MDHFLKLVGFVPATPLNRLARSGHSRRLSIYTNIFFNASSRLRFRASGCGPFGPSWCPKISRYARRGPDLIRLIQLCSANAGTSNLNGQLTLRTRNNLTGKEHSMHSVIYLVGLIVVVMLILSALGLR